jgi:poly-gamma-glutamate synthesis protein (capsule biosynthesis protein)
MVEQGPAYPFDLVRPLFEGADLVVGNMEGTFTDRGVPLQKQYTFRTTPAVASGLAAAGFDAVSLANNHATDFGTTSLEDTLAALTEAGVPAFGAGAGAAAAEAPLVLRTADGARVAFVGFSDIGEVLWAKGDQSGVARADAERIGRAVQAARAEADYVVLFVHWGAEYTHAPTDRQRALARAAVEAGADLVLGAHPHVLQPCERIEDGLVLYSLGNFVFDLYAGELVSLGEGPFQSAVAHVTLSKSAPPRVEFRPVRIDPTEVRPRPATPEEAAPILAQLAESGPTPH